MARFCVLPEEVTEKARKCGGRETDHDRECEQNQHENDCTSHRTHLFFPERAADRLAGFFFADDFFADFFGADFFFADTVADRAPAGL